MLPPMRPRPIIASFIDCVSLDAAVCGASRAFMESPLAERFRRRGAQRGEPALDVLAEMHAQGTPAALGEHREIAAGLRGLHHAERVLRAGDLDVLRVVAGDRKSVV